MSQSPIDAMRSMPAWEDDFVVVGGPESNRALTIGAGWNRNVDLASAEIRHDLFTFPGGAIAVLGFVDGGQSTCDCTTLSAGSRAAPTAQQPAYALTTGSGSLPGGWVVGPGVGIALRLLRNATLIATVGHAEGATRFYLSSGWSW